jgi:hypothetical protein
MQRLSLQQHQQKLLGGLAAGATAAAMGWTAGSCRLGLERQQAVLRC